MHQNNYKMRLSIFYNFPSEVDQLHVLARALTADECVDVMSLVPLILYKNWLNQTFQIKMSRSCMMLAFDLLRRHKF